jgi:hypothetical protein
MKMAKTVNRMRSGQSRPASGRIVAKNEFRASDRTQASAAARNSQRRSASGRYRSAIRPPRRLPAVMPASVTPITAVQVYNDEPRWPAISRPATSSTIMMQAQLKKKTACGAYRQRNRDMRLIEAMLARCGTSGLAGSSP